MHDAATGYEFEVDQERKEAIIPSLGVLLDGGHGTSDSIPHLQRTRLAWREIFAAQDIDSQIVVAIVCLGVGSLLQNLVVTITLVPISFQLGQQILHTMNSCGA